MTSHLHDTDRLLKALADPSRRKLLDLLRARDGRTLNELCEHLDVARQGVTRHLDLLEAANLIATVRLGREKLHFLNPVPLEEFLRSELMPPSGSETRSNIVGVDKTEEHSRTPMAGELIPAQMSKQYHVTLRSLRFYEEQGLISSRRAGGWRFYDNKERKRLEIILRGKELGFSLAEIKEIVNNAGTADIRFENVLSEQQILEQIKHLEQRRDEIDSSITKLREILSRRQEM
jgi:DNA-binding transcriptional MerR regulator